MDENDILLKIKNMLFSKESSNNIDETVKEVLLEIINNNPNFLNNFNNFKNIISKIIIDNKIVIDIDNISVITSYIKDLFESFTNLKNELNNKLFNIDVFSKLLKIIFDIITSDTESSEENNILISKLDKIIDNVIEIIKVMQLINFNLK
jgi:hypothetical protein